ncbi:FAD-dependent oxidoreductase [Candidatus Sumerlaeota bacterium]
MRVIIVGGAAAGPKAAARIGRVCPDPEIILFEKGKSLSLAACGLPYLVGGEVADHEMLMATPTGAPRNSAYFEKVKNVSVRIETAVTSIDPGGKRVAFENLRTGEKGIESYDKLLLATGASPIRPPVKGVDLKHIVCLHTIEDSQQITMNAEESDERNVVIVGAGLIGVETAEALVAKGCRVTVVELLPQVLQMLDREMAMPVQRQLTDMGVRVLTETRVEEFLPASDGQSVAAVRTSDGELPADLVILGVGVRPNIELAQAAGLEIGALGAIVTNERMRTSDPHIYAAGDCVETRNLLTGKACYIPLGSTANKQGRVAANSICGIDDAFPGVLGSAICKVFDVTAARTGLSEQQARDGGYDVVTALCPGPDRPHFMPGFKMLILKLIADRQTGRLLGAQAVGAGSADKRINVAATAITARMTVDDISRLDLAYAPPYSPAMDNIITAANIVRNKINGLMDDLSPAELWARMNDGEDFFLLDPRAPDEVAAVSLPGTDNIPLNALRERLDEVPADGEIVCLCMLSLRGYEAARMLNNAGRANVRVLDGGIAAWPYEKITKGKGAKDDRTDSQRLPEWDLSKHN